MDTDTRDGADTHKGACVATPLRFLQVEKVTCIYFCVYRLLVSEEQLAQMFRLGSALGLSCLGSCLGPTGPDARNGSQLQPEKIISSETTGRACQLDAYCNNAVSDHRHYR